MQLTEPIYLWALMGLLVPLAIHLLSRKAGKVVQVGSIRHFVDANPRKFSSLRFNEYVLFALRALAIVLFVLVLSGLIRESKNSVPRWVLLENESGRIPGLQKSLDSLKEAGYELRYWAEGFPLVEEAINSPMGKTTYPQLLKELDQIGAEAIIYARNRMSAFRGKQLALPGKVKWLQLPERKRQTTLEAVRIGGDSVMVLRGATGPDRTSFRQNIKRLPVKQTHLDAVDAGSDEVAIELWSPIRILILTTAEMERQTSLLKSAIQALEDFTDRSVTLEEAKAIPDRLDQYDFIFNTSRKEWSLEGISIPCITFEAGPDDPLLCQTGPYSWAIRSDLDRQSVLRENFLVRLGEVLFRSEELERRIRQWDQRTIDESLFFNKEAQEAKAAVPQTESMNKWLILALILLFIVERILAFYRQA